MKKVLTIGAILIIGIAIINQIQSHQSNQIQLPDFKALFQQKITPAPKASKQENKDPVIVKGSEEEMLVTVVEKSLPSVVTIGINFTTRERGFIEFDPTNPFGFRQIPGREREVEQNIGSGFVVSEDGLIITNKHVVSQEDATYRVLLNSGDTLTVENIYRDPLNDLAILKVQTNSKLTPLTLGDSDNLRLGQTVIAIGTPLGEFTNSVTKGIISGLGRGITAGSPFEGFVERLDNVIQTDAAISAGNSGGPLLNLTGQVIGVNTAVSSQGENIGFAIPVEIVKTLMSDFERRGGSFERPYLGVRYQMIDRRTAIANGLAEGAYVISVVPDSPADTAGIQEEDVIMRIDGARVVSSDDQSITRILLEKQVGQRIQVTIWREGEEKNISIVLGTFTNQ